MLESQLRQIFASVVWTHKIQEKQADRYLKTHNILENWRMVLSAVTTSGIVAVIFIDGLWLKIITAIISAISSFISIYYKNYDLKSLQKDHKNSAIDLLELREDLVSTLCDIKFEKYNQEELLKKRDEFIERKIQIAKCTLDADQKSVNEASDNLKKRQDNTYSDEEIDSYLPTVARKIVDN